MRRSKKRRRKFHATYFSTVISNLRSHSLRHVFGLAEQKLLTETEVDNRYLRRGAFGLKHDIFEFEISVND